MRLYSLPTLFIFLTLSLIILTACDYEQYERRQVNANAAMEGRYLVGIHEDRAGPYDTPEFLFEIICPEDGGPCEIYKADPSRSSSDYFIE